MTHDEIYSRLREILISDFEIPEESITLESRLYEELGLDSIDAVDLAVRVQQITGKRITPDDFKHVRSVSDVVESALKLMDG